jgi:TonB family protein
MPLHVVITEESRPTPPLPVAQTGWRSLLPGPRYYRTKELDVRPGIKTHVEPAYPESAARRFVTGKVVIRLFIDESGAVERVTTVKAEPPGYFEQAAERAFLAARFTPGMKGGRPVKVQMLLEVSFDGPPAPAVPGAAAR